MTNDPSSPAQNPSEGEVLLRFRSDLIDMIKSLSERSYRVAVQATLLYILFVGAVAASPPLPDGPTRWIGSALLVLLGGLFEWYLAQKGLQSSERKEALERVHGALARRYPGLIETIPYTPTRRSPFLRGTGMFMAVVAIACACAIYAIWTLSGALQVKP